jgi:hypothetical protein
MSRLRKVGLEGQEMGCRSRSGVSNPGRGSVRDEVRAG